MSVRCLYHNQKFLLFDKTSNEQYGLSLEERIRRFETGKKRNEIFPKITNHSINSSVWLNIFTFCVHAKRLFTSEFYSGKAIATLWFVDSECVDLFYVVRPWHLQHFVQYCNNGSLELKFQVRWKKSNFQFISFMCILHAKTFR